jgi:hypothetical protein
LLRRLNLQTSPPPGCPGRAGFFVCGTALTTWWGVFCPGSRYRLGREAEKPGFLALTTSVAGSRYQPFNINDLEGIFRRFCAPCQIDAGGTVGVHGGPIHPGGERLDERHFSTGNIHHPDDLPLCDGGRRAAP